MRNPERILNSLTNHSKDLDYKFERLYRILFNEEMYLAAYQKLQSKTGNMTPGIDEQSIDGMSMCRIEQLIQSLKDESYQPNPSKRVYIPKKNGEKRPLGIPSFNDKLLQEIVRMILEAIYEGSFEDTSHGFRPQRSCHTALVNIQKTYNNTKWFIEGDIKGFFDNINHEVLVNILKERIADERFLRLIRKFLNAGFIEDWKFQNTYSGTPQGGIISPIMANIYLDKLDKYIKEYIQQFDKGLGVRRRRNPEAVKLYDLKSQLNKKLKKEKDENVKKQLTEQIKAIIQKRQSIPASDSMDDSIKRLKYTRYADDFIIGIIGSKDDCFKIKNDIKKFLDERLKLELSDEKTLITNAKRPAKFLGYNIFTRKSNDSRRDVNGNPVRSLNGKIVLSVGTDVLRKKLLDYSAVKITTRNGKEFWKPMARPYLYNNDELEILMQYNAEIRGLYNYYNIANNCFVISSFYHIMEYSMYKTFAGKLRTTMSKVINKYTRNKRFIISYVNKRGEIKYIGLYHDGFKRKKSADIKLKDEFPRTVTITGCGNGLITRLKAQVCEYCGSIESIEVHHIRKLKDLKGKQEWEKRMIARNRKTMVLCSKCHHKLHAGNLD
jgi:group II intron reverse transcriptase/maturase|nr:MAG TPA: Reverse transcriptase [Caudoviricetes sp.]